MTMTCSNCGEAFDPTTDDLLVACPHCGHTTFSTGATTPPPTATETE